MILEQEHIINKVFLEVDTNSTAVGNDLKDRLGMFLKNDILPYLENYFKSIEQQLPAEIVQIPQLTLDIKVNSQDNFNALKKDTKEKLVQKIDAILKSSSQATDEVILINTQEHQARSLLFFIENGYTPWWKTSSESIQFTGEEMTEIASSNSFSNTYIQLLQKPVCKKRCIQQFTDQELQILLTATFKHTKEGAILQDDFINSLTSLSTISRDFIWNEVISYLQSKNITVLIEKLSSVLIKSTSIQDVRVYAFAKAVLTLIQQGFKITKTETVAVLQKKGNNTPQQKETLVSQLITVFDTLGLSKEANAILQSVTSASPSFKKQKETQPKEQRSDEAPVPNKITSKHIEKDQEKTTVKESETTEKEITTLKEKRTTSSNDKNDATKNLSEIPKEKEETDWHIDTSQEKVAQQYEEFITQFDQESRDPSTIDTSIKEITSQQEEVFLSNTGSYYVLNAGLIILHPYLKQFFYNCQILDDTNTLTDPEMAVHALHYLATKKEQQLESQMLFEKFLCGIPVKSSIQRHIQLSDTIKQQAEELLESVIENWGVLNNASPDLIRHEFLQRAGTLSFKEDNPKIVIERKTQDILVDKLPWGIGICRLPWLDHLVYTNW
ncbi:contractile injection system tape measure protein [uncultured Dokdonia sp.]|uniref:contractile injection system tape measure protein n=1 Tax=uncultured Dokdonia sp. TaxID=575653 RepID=UPI00260AA038|nr:contractile injection system tape measure protein [uncultured Dokdonia sp.]